MLRRRGLGSRSAMGPTPSAAAAFCHCSESWLGPKGAGDQRCSHRWSVGPASAFTHARARMHMHVHTCMHMHARGRTWTHTHTHMHTHARTWMHMDAHARVHAPRPLWPWLAPLIFLKPEASSFFPRLQPLKPSCPAPLFQRGQRQGWTRDVPVSPAGLGHCPAPRPVHLYVTITTKCSPRSRHRGDCPL